jgi:uncharacterized protein
MTPPGAVFDAVTYVQALASPGGPAAACWQRARAGEVILYVSEESLAELADVLARPKLARRLNISGDVVRTYLAAIRDAAVTVADVPVRFTYPRDPKDEPLVNLALAAGAKYLVTWDNDLLDLMAEGDAAGQALRAQAPNLSILTPPELLQVFRTAAPGGPTGSVGPA